MTESGLSASEFFISRVLIVSNDRVFLAWTEPAQLRRWWGPRSYTSPECEIDLRLGGRYRIVMRDAEGVVYPIHGIYHEILPPVLLRMTMDCFGHLPHLPDSHRPSPVMDAGCPGGEMLQTVTFENLGGITLLTVHTQFESPQLCASLLAMGMYDGWSRSLERLATLLVEH